MFRGQVAVVHVCSVNLRVCVLDTCSVVLFRVEGSTQDAGW